MCVSLKPLRKVSYLYILLLMLSTGCDMMFLNQAVNQFAYQLYKNKLFPHQEIRTIQYGMLAIRNELIKVCLSIQDKKRRQTLQRISIFSTMLLLSWIQSTVANNIVLYHCGLRTILFQALQLIIAKEMKIWK
jgi:hypothetical protein